jgi:hypothetical protein
MSHGLINYLLHVTLRQIISRDFSLPTDYLRRRDFASALFMIKKSYFADVIFTFRHTPRLEEENVPDFPLFRCHPLSTRPRSLCRSRSLLGQDP